MKAGLQRTRLQRMTKKGREELLFAAPFFS